MIAYHCKPAPSEATLIATPETLAEAAQSARPGAHIKVSGRLTRDINWVAGGTEAAPIWIDFGSTLLKNLVFFLNGDWVRVRGGRWQASQVTVTGDDNRVSRCTFDQGMPGGNAAHFNSAVLICGTAARNRVDHCLVENWRGRGIRHAMFKKEGKHNIIDHNHFRQMSDGKTTNGREAIQIGAGHSELKLGDMGTHVCYNLIEGYDLESEAISIKANGNFIYNNTLADCPISSITCRSGSNNTIAANTLVGTAGIIVYADNNKIIDNLVTGSRRAEIGIRSGDCTVDQLRRGEFQGGHPAAQQTTCARNQVKGRGIRIGEKGRGKIEYYDSQWDPASAVILDNNQAVITYVEPPRGKYQDIKHESTTANDTYVRLQLHAGLVGLDADDIFCPRDPATDTTKMTELPQSIWVQLMQIEDRLSALEASYGRQEQ